MWKEIGLSISSQEIGKDNFAEGMTFELKGEKISDVMTFELKEQRLLRKWPVKWMKGCWGHDLWIERTKVAKALTCEMKGCWGHDHWIERTKVA